MRRPGIRLGLADKDLAFKLEVLVGTLESTLLDAAISLEDFEESQSELTQALRNRESELTVRQRQAPFVYAGSFISAMDRVGKVLAALCDFDGVPDQAKAASAQFYSELPDLKGVRDSAQHFDERIQGKVRDRPLPQKGALWLSNLNGNTYEMTMQDGEVGRIEVSRTSLDVAARCIQEAIDALPWTGPVWWEANPTPPDT